MKIPRIRACKNGKDVYECPIILNIRAKQQVPDHDRLFATAEGQDGCFTMAQAEDAGFGRSSHSYHVKAGNWTRETRGVYRLRQFPVSETAHLVVWWLWSRGRDGRPQGVYSHATALALRDLADANPSKLDMTVPPLFRKSAATPPVLVLHKARLTPGEIVRVRGYAVTSVLRAITDCARSGAMDRDQLRQALAGGVARGLVTRREIRDARKNPGLPDWLAQLLKETAA